MSPSTPPWHVPSASTLVATLLVASTTAIDNGIGWDSPPMGWRSWNQFQCNINQSLIEAQYEAMVMPHKRFGPNAGTTTLLDLGYKSAGIDDCWQKCGSGPDGKGFHDASGYPQVDTDLFPDMKAMTTKAKSLGIHPGWYGNNCHCADRTCCDRKCFEGDVKATLDYGFTSIKLDGCGCVKNITLYAELFNASGVEVMLENCHNGNPTYPFASASGVVDCPMNFFRSSTDIRPTFGSILINLESVPQYNGNKLTGHGCWAYPDMLEVGVTNSQRPGFPTLSFTEARTHFGAWCTVSAPLVIGMDLTDATKLAEVWPILANEEAIAVNQAFVGDTGTIVAKSSDMVKMNNCSWFNGDGCQHPAWMVLAKTVSTSPKRVAVLLMNNMDTAADVSVPLSTLGVRCAAGEGCPVRDIWENAPTKPVTVSATAKNVASRDSAFWLITEA
eukprot:m.182183 g.182183  ORF g.182183 m.182183 type:complete len:444 (+) comp15463_c0_seq1:267-1598(+)